jgi:hypothetical protein
LKKAQGPPMLMQNAAAAMRKTQPLQPLAPHDDHDNSEDVGTGLFSDSGRPRPPTAPQPSWWGEPNIGMAKHFDGIASASCLLGARILKHGRGRREKESLPLQYCELYESLGAVDPQTRYVAVWLNMEDKSLVFICKATSKARFDKCLEGNFLKDRSKLIISPVDMVLPLPAKGPKDASTIGDFFAGACDASRCVTPSGAEVSCIRIDFYSVWLLRLAIRSVAFRPGNVLDLFLVDYPERTVFAGCRLSVTPEMQRMLA